MSLNSTSVAARRKFLVVIDDTPECRLAVRFAAKRAARTGGNVTLLTVIPPADFQHWATIEDLMQEEARGAAEALLQKVASEIFDFVGLMSEFFIRVGNPKDELLKIIKEDRSIRILVLGAASGTEGPGPLVSSFAGQLAGSLPIPITIVPGGLTPAEIDELS